MLMPAVIVMAILDTAGIASIVPFLALLSNPNAVQESELLSWAYEAGAFTSRESFFFAVGLGVLSVLTLGNTFSALTTWALLRFSWLRNHTLSMRLLESYLNRPYAYFLTQNTSKLAQKILSEVNQVVSGIFVAGIRLSARLIAVAAILIALLAIDPVMAIGVAVVFGGVYGVLYVAVRRTLTRLGQQRLKANHGRFRLATEMLVGIKEVKLAGLEATFLERFGVPSLKFADTLATHQIISQIPRYALETIAFGGVMLLVLYLLRTGRQLTDALPVLGIYAFAAYRMLPSLQQVFAGVSGLRMNLPALDSIVQDIPSASEARATPERVTALPFREELKVSSVSFRYEGGEGFALQDIDLALRAGEWVAFVGTTGSGKSTLVDIMLGLLSPTHGTLSVDGVELGPENLARWQANAGYVPQQIFLADDTVAQNIAFGAERDSVDQARLEHAAKVAQIHDVVTGELPEGYQTVVGERGVRLSGGQRQRLGIARAIYRQPRFVVLDEATSALDNETETLFFESLRGALKDVSVVSIAHRLTTTKSFDRIFVIEHGRIVDAGRYPELCARHALFREQERAAGSAELPVAADAG